MDDFTRSILEEAYDECRCEQGKGRPVRLRDLLEVASRLYAVGRNVGIEARAAEILGAVPDEILGMGVDLVDVELERRNLHWEWPDAGDEAYWVAFGLAVLERWHQERDGRVQVLVCEGREAEIQAWLDEQQPVQLALF